MSGSFKLTVVFTEICVVNRWEMTVWENVDIANSSVFGTCQTAARILSRSIKPLSLLSDLERNVKYADS